MKLKTNLHFHTADDKEDSIPYSFEEALNEAVRLGFSCIALTCHNTYAYTAERAREAGTRGVLLIPGIERTVERKHILILNCDDDILSVHTFQALAAYKKTHPDIFVIAPHPYLGDSRSFSLGGRLEEHISIFDAVEQTWFYSSAYNPNKKAAKTANRHSLPLIATSDTHQLRWLNASYAEIGVKEKTIPAVFDAIRKRNFKNVSSPRSLLFEMTPYVACHAAAYYFSLLTKTFMR